MVDENFTPGDLAYDIAQNREVVVTGVDCPSVDEHDAETHDLITSAHANQIIGFDPDTPTIDVAFPKLKSQPTTEYTFPATRLRVPDVTKATGGFSPGELAQYHLLYDLFAEAATRGAETARTLETLCLATGVDGPVLIQGRAPASGELE